MRLIFSLILLILFVAASYLVYELYTVKQSNQMLARQNIPLSNLSGKITVKAEQLAETERQFTRLFDETSLEEGKVHLEKLREYLSELKKITSENPQNQTASDLVVTTEKTVQHYDSLYGTNGALKSDFFAKIEKINQLKTGFITECQQYLNLQQSLLQQDIRARSNVRIGNRTQKLLLINSLLQNGIELFDYAGTQQKTIESNSGIIDQVEQQLTQLESFRNNEPEQQSLGNIRSSFSDFKSIREQITALTSGIEKNKISNNELAEKFNLELHELTEKGHNQNIAEASQSAEKLNNLYIFIIIICLFVFIILYGSTRYLAVNITASLEKGIEFARQLAQGNLTARIDVNRKDEIGELAKALDEMAEKMRLTIEEVQESARFVSNAGSEIRQVTQTLAVGAASQSQSSEEVSSSIEQMVSNISQNTDNARETEKISVITAQGVRQVQNSAEIAINSMREIADKISIINDIAFQTNILALNAAVEAARAGEHGRGFAVVASEVRKLAERSKKAAEEIDVLSKNGMSISQQAGKDIQQVLPEMEKTVRLVQEIVSASVEQNTGAGQINHAIHNLNQITQSNSSSSETLTQSAELLAQQAQKLNEVISYFQVKTAETKKNQTVIATPKLQSNTTQPVKPEQTTKIVSKQPLFAPKQQTSSHTSATVKPTSEQVKKTQESKPATVTPKTQPVKSIAEPLAKTTKTNSVSQPAALMSRPASVPPADKLVAKAAQTSPNKNLNTFSKLSTPVEKPKATNAIVEAKTTKVKPSTENIAKPAEAPKHSAPKQAPIKGIKLNLMDNISDDEYERF